jgi:DNA-binding MarR family transcriptional regulator
MVTGMESAASLRTVLHLALARTVVIHDVDRPLSGHHGLGISDLALLMELLKAPTGRMQRVELARSLGITTSGLARQLAPLEKLGIVARESSPGDARLALVVLTAAGAELARNAERTAGEAAARALAAVWSSTEQERLAALVAKVRGR